ncbi:MAG: hypothetical protein PVJ60_00855 [Phycisphaerales bacterium]|jgi:hypothetical protein
MTDQKHTPLPLKLGTGFHEGDFLRTRIYSESEYSKQVQDDTFVALIETPYPPNSENWREIRDKHYKRAALIVRACNSYYDMLEALKEARAMIGILTTNEQKDEPMFMNYAKKLNASIAKAEKGE